MANLAEIRAVLGRLLNGSFRVEPLGPKRVRVVIPSSTARPVALPEKIAGATVLYKSPTTTNGRKSVGSFPQFQAQAQGPAPSLLELMVLRIIQRMLKGWFSVSKAQVLWDQTLGRNVIAIPFDRASYLRLPKEYMGVPIRHFTPNPSLARRSATILDGVPMLSVNQGTGIGWPAITSNWNGGVGPYCITDTGGSMTGMLPAYVATRPGCVCQH